MNSPTFVAIGHMVYDIVPSGLALGGAASYSSLTARNLGLKSGVVTSIGPDFKVDDPILKGIEIVYQLSAQTTKFQNIYNNCGKRQQFIRGMANRIRSEHVPVEWKAAPIVYICPVADEVDLEIANCFSNAIIGVSPQGWMRQWDKEGRVRPKRWPEVLGGRGDVGRGSASALQIKTKIDAIILSEEDLTAFPDQLSDYLSLARYVLLTQGKNGATLFAGRERFHYPAFQTAESDPTGAGDVFAAAFLIKYFQTLEPHRSTIFANCVASFAVEKEGTRGIPNLQQVLERLEG